MTEPDRVIFGPSPPRVPATDARLRAMATQLRFARGETEYDVHDGFGVPRRMVLLGLARRSLPVCDQATLIGMAQEGEESTC